jgi:hypothetical protein
MANTYELERQSYLTPYVPDTAPKGHWSTSPEWLQYLRAKENATRLYPIGSVNGSRVAETPEMKTALDKFNAAFPPEEPEPTPVMDARTAELQAAQIELQRAVTRMRKLAHPDRIVGLVQRMVGE